jgi:hypothetical protein
MPRLKAKNVFLDLKKPEIGFLLRYGVGWEREAKKAEGVFPKYPSAHMSRHSCVSFYRWFESGRLTAGGKM